MAATALVAFKITQFVKQGRIFPDILKRLGANITCSLGEVTAGQDIAVHIYQADQLTGKAALGAAGGEFQVAAFELFSLFFGPLEYDPVVLGRTGGPYQHVRFLLFHIVMPVEHVLILGFRD